MNKVFSQSLGSCFENLNNLRQACQSLAEARQPDFDSDGDHSNAYWAKKSSRAIANNRHRNLSTQHICFLLHDKDARGSRQVVAHDVLRRIGLILLVLSAWCLPSAARSGTGASGARVESVRKGALRAAAAPSVGRNCCPPPRALSHRSCRRQWHRMPLIQECLIYIYIYIYIYI